MTSYADIASESLSKCVDLVKISRGPNFCKMAKVSGGVVFKLGNGENVVRLTSIKMEACLHFSIYRLLFEVTSKI
jgi:hypothetical protein